MSMIIAFAAAAALYYYYKRRVSVTKEELNDISSLHAKLQKEILQLKKEKKEYLIEPTIDDFNKQIFEISNQGKDQYTIDLHGLFVNNALKYLNERIYKLTKEKYKGNLIIITGRGNHSKDGQAKIRPRISTFLKENNFLFKESPGSFEVSFNKSNISILK